MRWTRALPLFAATASTLDAAGWRSQSIYQVVTDRFARTDGSTTASCSLGNYCGGSFQGLIKKLDYIQGMGFTAIWISPVIANINTTTPYGLPYHGYWPQDNYAINPKFGSAADLVALSDALHDRGMYLMVDVVPNHMAYNGAPTAIDYTKFNPFNKQSYFHTPYCAIDYDNVTSLTACWMGDKVVSLPDLKNEDATVQSMWNTWVTQFVTNYSIDGLRVDSAGQINKSFFPSFVTGGGVYQVGEVLNGSPDFLCDYQNYMSAVLNYAYYFWLVSSFSAGGSLTTLSNNIGWLKSTCADVTVMPTFIENHDQKRWPSFVSDDSLITNAIAFTILSDGIPLVYYGQEQGFSGATDPNNREPMWPSKYDTTTTPYKFISNLNMFRNFAISKDSAYASKTGKTLYSDAATLVRSKGSTGSKVISIWTNDGEDAGSRTLSLTTSLTGFAASVDVYDVISCTKYTTDSSGGIKITITDGMPQALYLSSGLKGSGLCGTTSTVSTSVAAVRIVSTSAAVSTSSVKSTLSTLATSTTSSVTTSSSSSTPSSTSTSSAVKTSSTSAVPTSTSSGTTPKTTSTSSVIPSSTSTSSVPKTTSTSLVPTSSSVSSSTSTSSVQSMTSSSSVEQTTSSSTSSSSSVQIITSSSKSSLVTSSSKAASTPIPETSSSSTIPVSTSTSSTVKSTSSTVIATSTSSSTIPTSTSSSVISTSSSTVSISPAEASSTLAISTTNKCGAAVGLTCAGSNVAKGGQCCSRYNSCGATSDYCCPQRLNSGGGCQAGYGNCLDANDSICVAASAGTAMTTSSITFASSSSSAAPTTTSSISGSSSTVKTLSSATPTSSSTLSSSSSVKTTSTTLAASTSSSSSIKTTKASTKVASCSPAASVIVAFKVNATTTWGQNVYLTGSADELNSWNTSVALSLSSDDYPIWRLDVSMAVDQYFEYKFIKASGSTTAWEDDPNRNYTVPTVAACSVATPVATIGGSWQD